MSDQASSALPAIDIRGARTRSFLAVCLGLVGLLGGGVLSAAAQWILVNASDFTAIADGSATMAVVTALPILLLGSAAVVLGAGTTQSLDDTAAVAGRVGVALGALAIVGAALEAILILTG